MKILIVGSTASLEEARLKFGSGHGFDRIDDPTKMNAADESDVVFDFAIHHHPEAASAYHAYPRMPVFLNTSFLRLGSLNVRTGMFGFCGLPSLFNRDRLEISCTNRGDESLVKSICEKLNTPYEIVADRAGLVTPRIICMIINEAYAAEEDGTATRSDIDLAMKLGTNYPYGPFDWSQRIGISNVVRVLEAAHRDSGDERYVPVRSLVKGTEI